MLEKEAKKQREWIRGKTEERLDEKILDLEGQVKDILDEIRLVQGGE
jgi:hypothetical protein